ncbi:hypothetical protein TNCT6_66530 [Streptomyces sp. 6-11-2]|nr:hypothetical protein TNCT6_66530 [Streptomyces sp. 6-11-2]
MGYQTERCESGGEGVQAAADFEDLAVVGVVGPFGRLAPGGKSPAGGSVSTGDLFLWLPADSVDRRGPLNFLPPTPSRSHQMTANYVTRGPVVGLVTARPLTPPGLSHASAPLRGLSVL